ncbi:hypothetical protein PISL3812_01025 [Talaromyces islandicus]|uniref:Uncharacterized protein n=1 Tax=Talaromyces islandicus TaxID=28573 RepID=A0A0U1LN12_TALIS|nr:hypothetical protein PISL3812_01025 [Talaromyces islandicus]
MEKTRLAARAYITRTNSDNLDGFQVEVNDEIITLPALQKEISPPGAQDVAAVNEDLLVVQSALRKWNSSEPLGADGKEAAHAIYAWLVQISLPSSDFAQALEAEYSDDRSKKVKLTTALRAKRSTYDVAISCIEALNSILSAAGAENAADIFTALASFTNTRDPWTTSKSCHDALAVLETFLPSENAPKYWDIVEQISKSKIRSIFAKTKNIAITGAGRKNLHPMPQPRFDGNIFNPEAKPWKHVDVYATTVLEWVLSQYTPSDIARLEDQFQFYVPPILSLLDDESPSFKYRGCDLLIRFLKPIQSSNSDLLRRTNLSSVFDDALTPTLLSLPTLTPEDESLQILGITYEALLLTLQTRYHIYHSSSDQQEDNGAAYTSRLTTLLRDNVISSFHHISSYTPTSKTEPSMLASFPYPRLSTFILDQLKTVIHHIGIHTTKYLQEIIPVIYSTLTNPFGTAHLPLLAAGVAAAQAVILNSHPRIWRYRGEFLAAFCACWMNVSQEEKETNDLKLKAQLQNVMKKLQGAANILNIAVQSAVSTEDEDATRIYWTGVTEGDKIDMRKEVEDLVAADQNLTGLFDKIDEEDLLSDDYFD